MTYVSCSYSVPSHDPAVAECRAELVLDEETRAWDLFKR